MRSRPMGNHW